ncbi:hypothetical protein Dsin_005516 [Dipteronia sinensis]|uniref:Response regulatory domain-containing protein n=1 Tax=Dipteronia sinensis TaxID=43782 RepID=A0AAE0EF01_9ROSI|nr:hypothetical protein Dsin_005516 [Dipteronia sinensis]
MAMTGEIYHSPMVCQEEELHVLAVDDSFVIVRLLKVTAVESGTRALQYLGLDGEEELGFEGDLIMTDYSMPGMNGYDCLKRSRSESSAFREIPVVIMSSENIMARIDRCLEEGAEEFIVKPVKLSDVKRLRDCIIKGDGEENVKKNLNKRKLQEDEDDHSVSSSPSTPVSPLSPSVARDLASSSRSPSPSPSPACSIKRPKMLHSS